METSAPATPLLMLIHVWGARVDLENETQGDADSAS